MSNNFDNNNPYVQNPSGPPRQANQQFPSNYGQPSMYYQKPKKSAYICSVVGFIFGLIPTVFYLIYDVLILSEMYGESISRSSSLFSSGGFVFTFLSLFVMPVVMYGPLVSLTLGIIAVAICNKPLQQNSEKAKRFGIISICLTGVSVLLFFCFIVICIEGLSSIY